MKKIKWVIAGLTVLIVASAIIFMIGNHYQMTEKRVEIPTEKAKLSAVITFPKQKKIKGIIVFVHGDGPQNATQDGGYKPVMEQFAKSGFLSVSWDKAGIGSSTGNWLDQSMDDRAKEVSQVIAWLKIKYPKEAKQIGLWGASQAGWVIPKVMSINPKIDFSILVGPAINWMRQGLYNTDWRIADAGGSKSERLAERSAFEKDAQLIKENATVDAYKSAGGKEKLSSDRYLFIRRNLDADATADLANIKRPLYLVLAEKDKNVDSLETKAVYTDVVKKSVLQVKTIANTEHMMLNPKIAHHQFLVTLTAVMMPKYFLVDQDYLDYCQEVAEAQ